MAALHLEHRGKLKDSGGGRKEGKKTHIPNNIPNNVPNKTLHYMQAINMLFYLIFKTIQKSRYKYAHLLDEKTEYEESTFHVHVKI